MPQFINPLGEPVTACTLPFMVGYKHHPTEKQHLNIDNVNTNSYNGLKDTL